MNDLSWTDFDARAAFGSHSDSDHVYNTPRAWIMAKTLSPAKVEEMKLTPVSDNIPWSFVPEHKITVEDVKYVLSLVYQGTKYNPYAANGDVSEAGRFRTIGINRNNFVAVTQLRPYAPKEIMAVEWIAEGSNHFNTMIPFYANVTTTPRYLSDTTTEVTTDNFYWANRLIAVIADSHYGDCLNHIERYQNTTMALGHEHLNKVDRAYKEEKPANVTTWLEAKNMEISDRIKKETSDTLSKVLYTASCKMKNAFNRSDA